MTLLRRIHVAVPATTSNLGPGFDCLGMALGLYNELILEVHEGPESIEVEIEGEGAMTLPRGRDNLSVKAALLVAGERLKGRRLLFKAVNRIPLARGLGSSAAAAAAGLCAGNLVTGEPLLNPEQLLAYAAALEGHPDNAAPALRGGLTVCLREGKDWRAHALAAHEDLRGVVCVPEFELATKKARAVLPPTVLREQAVANIARTALLVAALEHGRWEELGAAMEDDLHQAHRAALVPGLFAVLKAARQAGPCGAALSGAGPSVIALTGSSAHTRRIGAAMEAAFSAHGVKSHTLILPVDRNGARTQAR